MKASPAAVRFDPVLLGAVFLLALGLVMVYSASAVLAQDKQAAGQLLLPQAPAGGGGDGPGGDGGGDEGGLARLARFAYPLLMLTFVLLVLVLIPGVGTTAGGAQRWIRLPGFGLQPAEVAKFSWVVYLAYSLAKKREKVATFSVGFLPHLLLCGGLVLLCMKQPDFGSSVLLVFLLFVLFAAARS